MPVELPKRWTGPLDFDFDGLSLTDRKHSIADFKEENLETELGDFSVDVWGKKLIVTIKMDEIDDSDADTIEDTSSCSIYSHSKDKTMSLSGIKKVSANLQGRIVEIKIECVKTDGSRCWSMA